MPRRTRSRARKMRRSRAQSKRRTRAQSKRRTRAQRRTRARRGGASPSYPIPESIKMELWDEMMKNYQDHPRIDEADAMLEVMMYEPEYIGQFTGKSFEDSEDKEYWQGLDKIDAFFKYST